VKIENFGHTIKNNIFRLVKLLADLSTRLKPKANHRSEREANTQHGTQMS